MAEHYGTVIIPARTYKPKDKAKAENGVLIVERWLLARIRNETFRTLRALNIRLRELLSELNNRPMKGYGNQSRAERFRILNASASWMRLRSQRFRQYPMNMPNIVLSKLRRTITLNMRITGTRYRMSWLVSVCR